MAERRNRRGLIGLPFGLSSAAQLQPVLEEIQASIADVEPQNIKGEAPRPMQSLMASAGRLTSSTMQDSSFRKSAAGDLQWQQDAWSMYDLVGELRFLVDTMATRTSKAKLFVARIEDPQDEPVPVDDEKIQDILLSIGDGPLGLARLIERLVANLKVTGDGWLAGIPTDLLPEEDEDADLASKLPSRDDLPSTRKPVVRAGVTGSRRQSKGQDPGIEDEDADEPEDGPDTDATSLEDLRWFMLSVSEIQFHQGGQVTIQLGPADVDKIKVPVDDVHLVRVWKAHPQFSWQADSSVRSSLPVLRELVGLTMHISAQIDSRLAGAGVFIVPSSAAKAVKRAMGLPDDAPEDPFTDALLMSMLTPISDRSSAAAVVPLVLTVPDEVTDRFHHITFDKPLDAEARAMRQEAIGRFALGADAPPELLTGNADMNHWNGWLTREDVVSNHIEPVLGLICDAITSQFLRPVLKDNPDLIDPDELEKYVVWYSVQHLIVRNNRSGDAKDLFAAGAISEEALRYANGFDEDDAPEEVDDTKRASEIVLAMLQGNPGLIRSPGLRVLMDQVLALMKGKPIDMPKPPTPKASTPEAPAAPARPAPVAGPATSASPSSAPPRAGARALPVADQPVPSGMHLLDPADFGLRGSLSEALDAMPGEDELEGALEDAYRSTGI